MRNFLKDLPEIDKNELKKYTEDEIYRILKEGTINTWNKYKDELIDKLGKDVVCKYLRHYWNVPSLLALLRKNRKDYYKLIVDECKVWKAFTRYVMDMRKWFKEELKC